MATSLVERMSAHHLQWKTRVRSARSSLKSAFADCLFTAAFVTYFGCLKEEARNRLRQDWTNKLESDSFLREGPSMPADAAAAAAGNDDNADVAGMTMNENYSLAQALGLGELFAEWDVTGRLSDSGSHCNVTLLYAAMYHRDLNCRWPLLIDPDSIAETWIQDIMKLAALVDFPPTSGWSMLVICIVWVWATIFRIFCLSNWRVIGRGWFFALISVMAFIWHKSNFWRFVKWNDV